MKLTNLKLWSLTIVLILSCGLANASVLDASVKIAKSYVYIDEVNVPDFDSGSTLILHGSLSLDKIIGIQGFSINAEYFKSMSPISYQFKTSNKNDEGLAFTDILTRNFDHNAAGGYLAYAHPVTKSLRVQGRVGYVFSEATDETLITCIGGCSTRSKPVHKIEGIKAISEHKSISGGGVSVGMNISYTLHKHLFLGAEFTRAQLKYQGLEGEYGTTYIGIGLGFRI